MIASLKVAKVAHLALLKLATAKSVIGVGVLVGSAATGLVTTDILGPDYITGAAVLINQAVDAEGALPAAVPRTWNSEKRSAIDGDTATAGIPQLVVTAYRMSHTEKLAYDAQSRQQILASRH